MLLLAVLVTTASILFTVWYWLQKRKYSDLDKLPGPPSKLLTGNAAEFGSNIVDLFSNSQRMVRTYGRLVRIWQGPFRMNLFVTDPDMVEFFLSSQIHLKKSTGYDLYLPWLGEGLINSTGDMWRKHRKILTPAFHFKILEQFSDVFHDNFQILMDTFKSKSGQTIDVFHYLQLYAMDVLCETSMGINKNCQRDGDTSYIKSAQGFLEIYIKRFFSILKRYDFFFQFSNDYKDLQRYISTMHRITDSVIMKRKEFRMNNFVQTKTDDTGVKTKKVFMDILLDWPGLSNEEIRWQVDSFLFAGHDTVSSAMSFALYVLAKYPDVQKKILEEIHEVIGEDRTHEIKLSELKEMSYLDRVMKEVFRLYPPVPLYEREIMQDIEYNGLRIPAHTTISFHPFSQHRDPELFPDPEKFDPDRFLPEVVSKRHPFAFIPFSAGPRNCIGQKYAAMNAKTLVANMIRNFDLYPADYPHTPEIGNDAVMKSVNGLPIKVVYRE